MPAQEVVQREQCGKCGARRIDAQIGLEATPEAFISELVAVFRQIRRVMRDDAVAFVNLGDSYQDKQLQMIPARVALALQADGWILRSDVIWGKPNPMPESCRDRPTSAHEHVFLLTKRSRYYYDGSAVAEAAGSFDRQGSNREQSDKNVGSVLNGVRRGVPRDTYETPTRSCRNVWTIATAPFPAAHFATFPPELAERCIRAGTSERGCCAACGAPWVRMTERSFNVSTRIETRRVPVDNVAVGTYLRQSREALGLLQKDVAVHFPSVTGGLTGCVANWELGLNTPTTEQWTKLKEILELDARFDEQIYGTVEVAVPDVSPSLPRGAGVRTYTKAWNTETSTTGWSPSCQCNAETRPCTILDPFSGAGTALLVADRLGRDAIGIDLSHAYVEMARERLRADCPLFADISPPPAEDPEDERMADLFATAAD